MRKIRNSLCSFVQFCHLKICQHFGGTGVVNFVKSDSLEKCITKTVILKS